MNYGPLEFANYLRRNAQRTDSAVVRAARAAQPQQTTPVNLLRVTSGPGAPASAVSAARVEAVSVYEAVATGAAQERGASSGTVCVLVKKSRQPVVLVLSSHQPVEWRVSRAPGATLAALLLSGFGNSTVTGADQSEVHRIGGFYAFRRGSAEYRHLECEVMRCTGRAIENFQSVYAGSSFEIG